MSWTPSTVIPNLFQDPGSSRTAVSSSCMERPPSPAGRPWIFGGTTQRGRAGHLPLYVASSRRLFEKIGRRGTGEHAEASDPQPDLRAVGRLDPETSSG